MRLKVHLGGYQTSSFYGTVWRKNEKVIIWNMLWNICIYFFYFTKHYICWMLWKRGALSVYNERKFQLHHDSCQIHRNVSAFSAKIEADKSVWLFFLYALSKHVWYSNQSMNRYVSHPNDLKANCYKSKYFLLYSYIYLDNLFLSSSYRTYENIFFPLYISNFSKWKNFLKLCFFEFFHINI